MVPEHPPPSDARRSAGRSDAPGVLRVSPERVLGWTPEEADEALDRLEERVPVRPRFMEVRADVAQRAIVFGDSHGDWRSTSEVVDRFFQAPAEQMLIGLGDYIDRAPDDCGAGSVANALSLLALVADHPERVLLVVGNHELARRIPALPHDLPEEIDELWGPNQERYDRLLGLLERGPLAVRTESGVYLAHAGFPRDAGGEVGKMFERPSDDTLVDITWSDCAGSGYLRGVGEPLTEPEVRRFLARVQCRVFLRGHDPPLTGRPLFHGTVLTLHTTRLYEEYGGVLYATFPLDTPVENVAGVTVRHASVEGREFPDP